VVIDSIEGVSQSCGVAVAFLVLIEKWNNRAAIARVREEDASPNPKCLVKPSFDIVHNRIINGSIIESLDHRELLLISPSHDENKL
jgi:hypothetical protein